MKDYRRYHYDENKLIDYGFKKQGYNYIYKKGILDVNWFKSQGQKVDSPC